MNQYSSFLSIFFTLQTFLDKLPCFLKLAQKILIIDIVNLDAQMFVLLPVLEVLEVVPQDRDDVGNTRRVEGIPSTQGEYSVNFVSTYFSSSEKMRSETAMP